jgi:hypothetical protein
MSRSSFMRVDPAEGNGAQAEPMWLLHTLAQASTTSSCAHLGSWAHSSPRPKNNNLFLAAPAENKPYF